MFVRWLRVSARRKQQMWRMYGWFTGLMCSGSIFGSAAWASYLQFLVAFFTASPGVSNVDDAALNAVQSRWSCAFLVFYALEFMCLSVAKLLVLFRTIDLSMPQGQPVPSHWASAAWMVTRVVVAGNAVGVGSHVAAAVYFKQSADFFASASDAYARNATDDGKSLYAIANAKVDVANIAESVQNFCEVTVLALIIAAFLAAGTAFSRYATNRLQDLERASSGDTAAIGRVDEFTGVRSEAESMVVAAATAVKGSRTLRQVVLTAVFVCATFFLRATYSTMHALANAAQNQDAACATDVGRSLCDSTCYNTYFLMQTWLIYTPEFQMLIVLISSPLALLVARWGMTTNNMSKLLRSSQKKKTSHQMSRPNPKASMQSDLL